MEGVSPDVSPERVRQGLEEISRLEAANRGLRRTQQKLTTLYYRTSKAIRQVQESFGFETVLNPNPRSRQGNIYRPYNTDDRYAPLDAPHFNRALQEFRGELDKATTPHQRSAIQGVIESIHALVGMYEKISGYPVLSQFEGNQEIHPDDSAILNRNVLPSVMDSDSIPAQMTRNLLRIGDVRREVFGEDLRVRDGDGNIRVIDYARALTGREQYRTIGNTSFTPSDPDMLNVPPSNVQALHSDMRDRRNIRPYEQAEENQQQPLHINADTLTASPQINMADVRSLHNMGLPEFAREHILPCIKQNSAG